MTNRARTVLAALAVVFPNTLAGCILPRPCGTDSECQGLRVELYEVEPLTEAEVDSLLAGRQVGAK